MFHVKETRSRDAAYAAAERRWLEALEDEFSGTKTYCDIVDAIDSTMLTAATEAEVKWPGAGRAYIINRMTALGILAPQPEGKGV